MLEGIDGIEGLTPEQIEAVNGLAGGLAKKNAELLAKNKTVKEGSAASVAELEALQQFKSNADIQAAEDAKNWEEATRLKQEAHDKELSAMTDKLSATDASLKTVLIDNGLSSALDGVNINKDLKAGAVAMLQGQAAIIDGKAMIGEKSLSDAVNEWAASEQGKAFCLAPANSGGNASGGSNGASSSGKAYSDMTLSEQIAHNKKVK
jgi:hypothetical protein